MILSLCFGRAAEKALACLSADDTARILDALKKFAAGEGGDIKALKGPLKGTFRLRVGKWRIFLRRTAPTVMEVFEIENRGEAY